MFNQLGSKFHISTADHSQTDGLIERSNRVAAHVLRAIATLKDCNKHLPFVNFSKKSSVYVSTAEVSYYINGLHQPRTAFSFERSTSLIGGRPLTTLRAYAEEHNSFGNLMVKTGSADPASAIISRKQESVKSEPRQKLFLLQGNEDAFF